MKKIFIILNLCFISINIWAGYRGDGLGNHKARKALNMDSQDIDNTGNIDGSSGYNLTMQGRIQGSYIQITGTSTISNLLHVTDNTASDALAGATAGEILLTDASFPRIILEDISEASANQVFSIGYIGENLEFTSLTDNLGANDQRGILILDRDGDIYTNKYTQYTTSFTIADGLTQFPASMIVTEDITAGDNITAGGALEGNYLNIASTGHIEGATQINGTLTVDHEILMKVGGTGSVSLSWAGTNSGYIALQTAGTGTGYFQSITGGYITKPANDSTAITTYTATLADIGTNLNVNGYIQGKELYTVQGSTFNGKVRIEDGAALTLWDSTNADYMKLDHNGASGILEIDPGALTIRTAASIVNIMKSGFDGILRIYDSGLTDYVEISHNSTDGVISTNAGDLVINTAGNVDGNDEIFENIERIDTDYLQVTGSTMSLGGYTQFVYRDADIDDTEEYELTIADGKAGWGYAQMDVESMSFQFTAAGAVTLADKSANTSTTNDNDTTFNLYDNGTTIVFENQLGDNKVLTINVWYVE